MESPSLCAVCSGSLLNHSGILQAGDSKEGEQMWLFQGHADLTSLQTSRDAECPICVLFCRLLNEEQEAFLSSPEMTVENEILTFMMVWKDESLDAIGVSIEECWFLAVSFWELPDTWPGSGPQVRFVLEPIEDAVPEPITSDSTASKETWEQATKWINTCLTTHTHNQISPKWYPTRLLSVDTDLIQLIDTSTSIIPGSGSEYVTLSHSWGTANVLKLTKTTSTRLRNGIPLSSLPLTFQHAIQVTRRLGHKYIWIDSLCIYQDEHDKSDWLREALLMDKVYQHCAINIAGTGGKDSTSGLFSPTRRNPNLELRTARVKWLEKEYLLTDWGLLERELRSAPLNMRGWVLQERLLAPRILHFGRWQLFFECDQGGVLCERFVEKLPRSLQRVNTKYFSSLQTGGGDVYKLWGGIVRSYSRTKLTYPSDKLVAIAGIAKVMRARLGDEDEYVVGMWRSRLASHLLWQVSSSSSSPSSSASRKPSWSWLSVDGEVDFPRTRKDEEMMIEVMDVQVQYATKEITGPVTGGQIVLRGRLRPLQLRKAVVRLGLEDLDEETRIKVQEHGVSLDDYVREIPRVWTMNVGGQDLEMPTGEVEDRIGPIVRFDFSVTSSSFFDQMNKRGELFVMSAGGPYEDFQFHTLLILKCVDKDKGRFVRIGLAALDTVEKAEIFAELKRLDEGEDGMPCVEYDEGRHLHTIVLE
ncbi:HET-domain-containing protein [Poronia punctata]|nr:HET-domain-containing protein [Poronia punctata]